jgi:hypothetical protein
MNNACRRLLPCLCALAIAGCASIRSTELPEDRPETSAQALERRAQAPRPAYNLAGYPPAVKEGYVDGCESAKGSEWGRKDTKRFAADGQYSMGWNDGYSICKKK